MPQGRQVAGEESSLQGALLAAAGAPDHLGGLVEADAGHRLGDGHDLRQAMEKGGVGGPEQAAGQNRVVADQGGEAGLRRPIRLQQGRGPRSDSRMDRQPYLPGIERGVNQFG